MFLLTFKSKFWKRKIIQNLTYIHFIHHAIFYNQAVYCWLDNLFQGVVRHVKYFITILYHNMWMYILYCTCKNAHIAKSWNTVDYISIYSCNDIFKPSTCYFDPIVSKETMSQPKINTGDLCTCCKQNVAYFQHQQDYGGTHFEPHFECYN